ncbi:hypothetical protein HZA33_00795 [Candidatus Pacearchaeota archaeon]|nr:hypothetical protein [Candidatus Pacearchaeota archaeon]
MGLLEETLARNKIEILLKETGIQYKRDVLGSRFGPTDFIITNNKVTIGVDYGNSYETNDNSYIKRIEDNINISNFDETGKLGYYFIDGWPIKEIIKKEDKSQAISQLIRDALIEYDTLDSIKSKLSQKKVAG